MALITLRPIKAARTLLDWRQADLAEASDVPEISIKNIERGATDPRVLTFEKSQGALERGGTIFLSPDEAGGPGVRLRKVTS